MQLNFFEIVCKMVINCLQIGHINRESGFINIQLIRNLEIVIEIISEWPDYVKHAEKLRRLQNEIVERGCRVYDVKPSFFNTLNHDDLWCPNLMMKTQNGSAENPFENIIFIDFQFAYWSTSTTDLHFFFNTSMNDKYRPHQFEELVRFYYEHLVNSLKKLNYKQHVPDWEEFNAQYYSTMFLGKLFEDHHQKVDNSLSFFFFYILLMFTLLYFYLFQHLYCHV